ncbi:MAG: TIM44-like domain-containing protein [Myxococcales bacterium]
MRHARRLLRLWPALVLLLPALPALARVGGGQSFSGGSSFDSGGGGGGSGGFAVDVIWLLVRLCFVYPQVGVPGLIVAIAVVAVTQHGRATRGSGWSATGEMGSQDNDDYGGAVTAAIVTAAEGSRLRLLDVLREDRAFSLVLFEDFLYALYAATQEARGSGKLGSLSAYLSVAARRAAAVGNPARVEAVIVGGLHVIGAEVAGNEVQTRIRFESNYTEENAAGGRQTFYAVEIWTLARSRTAHSKPPAQARVLACPACGGPLDGVIGGKCSYCGKEVGGGDFDWAVRQIEILEREARPPLLFEDPGPPLDPPPTLTAPGADGRLAALRARDPTFAFLGFQTRVELIFQELQGAWSTRDWKRARPFASERLFQEWAHWMELYKAAHARNVVDRPHLRRLELADVESDAYYDSITVRLWASAADYTITDDGQLLAGRKDEDRPFSEYWTLIRGSAAKGPASTEKKCPQCGADLSINMAGRCEYCKAEVTSGQFDWVLSRIEQDAAYDG